MVPVSFRHSITLTHAFIYYNIIRNIIKFASLRYYSIFKIELFLLECKKCLYTCMFVLFCIGEDVYGLKIAIAFIIQNVLVIF